jgi:hypothetical protein
VYRGVSFSVLSVILASLALWVLLWNRGPITQSGCAELAEVGLRGMLDFLMAALSLLGIASAIKGMILVLNSALFLPNEL